MSESATHARHNAARRRLGLDPALPRLLGERLCLDFANSIEEPAGPRPQDVLQSYPDLVRWARHAGIVDAAQGERLLAQASRRPAEAGETYARALALRGAIDRVFHQIARGAPPAASDLATIQQEHLAALARAHLAPAADRFDWHWSGSSRLDSPLWLIARSAVDLLTGGDLRRVKECPHPEGCTWLFYDLSKNASRRWCSMEGCGTHVKMRRYRAKVKG
jgi:predicted RNA-binding Zn ribbon-like protein